MTDPTGSRYLDGDNDGVPDLAPIRPVGAAIDARNRAIRTFIQGLGTDVAVVLVLFLLPVFSADSFDWSTTDWKVLVLSLAKTVVVTLLSYLARRLRFGKDTITR